ncbi:MAG: hypothetical protein ACXABY_07540 [Candidatus Thorarchaeota archaeon]|jgi:hypothetical protein
MSFRYTARVGYSLFILTLLTPFNAMIMAITVDNVTVGLLAPLWQYIWHSTYPATIAFSPFGLVLFPYYGLSVYIAWLAYNISRNQSMERKQYAWRIAITIALQVAVMIIIPPFSGDPRPLNIPLPLVGIIALFLTRYTVKELTSPWEDQEALFESNNHQA